MRPNIDSFVLAWFNVTTDVHQSIQKTFVTYTALNIATLYIGATFTGIYSEFSLMLHSFVKLLRGTSATFKSTASTQPHNTRAVTIFNKCLFSRAMSATATTSPITSVVFDCGGVLAQDVPGIMYEKLSLRYPEDQRGMCYIFVDNCD